MEERLSSRSGILALVSLPSIFPEFLNGFTDAIRVDLSLGIGLGLSLARAIARAHGGDIIAMSTLDQGSTFTIILPKFLPPQA